MGGLCTSRCAYVSGNPRNYIDPTGRDSIDEFAGEAGTYIELGTGIGITVGGIQGGITGGIAGSAAGGVGAIPGAAAGATAGAGVGAAEGAAVGTIFFLGKAIYDRL